MASKSHHAFAESNGGLYFSANGPTGRDLYVTDGALGSTRLYVNLLRTRAASRQGLYHASGKRYLTVVLPDQCERESYVTCGTLTGTTVVENLVGSESSAPSDFYILGRHLWLSARLTQESANSMQAMEPIRDPS